MLEIHLDQDLTKLARQGAKATGVKLPNEAEIMKQLGISIPGLPFNPAMITGILSGKFDAKALIEQGVVQLTNILVPGMGAILSLALPIAEKSVEQAVRFLTGQPEKRKRRKRDWTAIGGIFNLVMDKDPLLIFADGKKIPSDKFRAAFKTALLDPKLYCSPSYYTIGSCQVPGWLQSVGQHKNDYEGSGISGKHSISYFNAALKDERIVQMLGDYYKLPGRLELRDKKIAELINRVKTEAKKIVAARPVIPGARAKRAEASKLQKNKAAKQQAEKTIVTKAATAPESDLAKKTEKALVKKKQELKKSIIERKELTHKAKKEAKKLREKIGQLKKALAQKPTDVALQQQVAQTTTAAVQQESTAAIEERLAAIETAQQSAVAQIQTAVATGSPVQAQTAATAYNAITTQKASLVTTEQRLQAAQPSVLQRFFAWIGLIKL